MRLVRNLSVVFLFVVALSVGLSGRTTAPPWVTYWCNNTEVHWGLEYYTNDCTDIEEFCSLWCGQIPYGYWCSTYGDGRTDGGCKCLPTCA